MKPIYTPIFFLLIAAFLTINAQSVDDLMSQGNNYYQKEEYREAIQKYEEILAQGYESPALYYNLGNAYFKIGRIGPSILNYERGLKLNPSDEDIRYNLKLVNARRIDRIEEVPKIFLVSWWVSLVTLFSAEGWLYIVLTFYLLCLLSVALFVSAKRMLARRTAVLTLASSLFLMIFTIIILVTQYQRERSNEYGILLESVITVKNAPDSKAGDAFVIHEGIKFEILDELNEWTKIGLADGKVGWLPPDSYAPI
jgi:tetratricopeptide (TPR) repeat protein